MLQHCGEGKYLLIYWMINDWKSEFGQLNTTNSVVDKWCCRLTGEVNGEAGLGDIKICLELNGDNVESRMDPIRKQWAAHFLQWHFVLWRPVPNLQDVVGRLRVERKKLKTDKIRTRQIIARITQFFCALDIYKQKSAQDIYPHCLINKV